MPEFPQPTTKTFFPLKQSSYDETALDLIPYVQ